MSGKYDMLNRKSRVYTAKHPPIPNAARAAQFAPFAALTGYEDTVRETARRTDSQIFPVHISNLLTTPTRLR